MKKLSDNDAAMLRTTYAAMMVALQRGRVSCGPELQRLMKAAWDIVREPADPMLSFQHKPKGSPILLPFGPGIH